MVDSNSSHNRRTYLKTVGALGAVGTTGLAGCTRLGMGGGGGGDSTITVAATVPESGRFSSLGTDVKRGYELGVSKMNEQLDQEVELLIQDDESSADVVRQNLQQMVSNNDVDMIWGSFSSLLVTAGSAFAENNDLPFLGAFFAYEQPHRNEGYEWTYSPFPKSRDVARSTKGLLELIPEGERPTNVGIWEPNTGWGSEQADAWEETLSGAGYDIVLRETFQIGSEDFSTLISQSDSADVEILLSNPSPPGGITSVNQMQSNNWTPKVLKYVRGADPSAWWSALGEKGAYACMCPGWVPGLTGGGNDQMRSAYEEEYGLDEGQLINTAVGGAYNVAQVASQTVQAADSTDPSDLQSALRSESFETVIGSFSFENNGLPAEGELTAPTGQWWNGNQHTVFPDVDGEAAIDFKYPIPAWGER
ncbi:MULTISPECIES: amino acid ABC transporter substrate-binding protein [Halorussus]|uniref:amino acid ABC transporter substrate-binding protein n=1 Tax=Halorussus TaxID=1070314 RepID=UPI000E219809|nr:MULTISPECIES: amino acid ABC transporter substrate-binding protein [Halorussus]NHN61648.1 ABC transporter substrate-binding protein [Halorussus sp. JP-T4]